MNIYFRSNSGIKEGLGHIAWVSNLVFVLKKNASIKFLLTVQYLNAKLSSIANEQVKKK